MKTITSKLIAILVLFLSLTFIVQAQDKERIDVNQICKTALELPFNEGIALIANSIDKCGSTRDASDCLMKLNFTAGYMYQVASNESTINQKTQLRRSLMHYQKAHEIDPSNISVINNLFLVYKALGNTDAAIATLNQAIKVDQNNKTKYEINKGDICYDSQDYKRAIEFYRPAFFADLNNEALAWKIFNSYAQIPDQNEAFGDLFKFSGELFDQGLFDLARNGFLYAVKSALAVNNNDKAEMACVSWAETISRKSAVSGSYADELPDIKTWSSGCNKQLQKLLTNSFSSTDSIRWWTANNYRRHIVASILLKMESEALMRNDVISAVNMLETALKIAPEFYVYDGDPKLKIYFPVKMDIAIELSRMYNRYPRLDLNKTKYDSLISELFNEKSMHYLQNDLASIQKSHTMLGLIFADRNIWHSTSFAGNAIFQLENAIKFQKRLEKENPEKFKPIPALYQTLAKGYKITHKPEMEYKTLIDAAIGYLDLDNLSMADSIIQTVKKQPLQDTEYQQKLKEIGLITSMRFNIRNGKYSFREKDVNALEKNITESELFKMKNLKNDSSFMNRQKFKILTDVGSKCTELNPSYKYPVFEIIALGYIDKVKALGNYQDINRLNHIEEKFQSNLDRDNVIKVNQNVMASTLKDRSKSWSLNSGGYKSMIEVNPDLIVAGKVYADIAKGSIDKNVDGLDQIQIRQGEVTIPKDLWEKTSIDKDVIQRVKGVSAVKMNNEFKTK
jgi:tetratricopeptide (TPR) repeat protein